MQEVTHRTAHKSVPAVRPKVDILQHQPWCFVCLKQKDSKKNEFVFCQRCTKTYHVECVEKEDRGESIGPCCKKGRKCQFCKKSPENEAQTIVCTICLLPAHRSCYWTPKNFYQDIPAQMRESLIFGEKSYVCEACTKINGIVKVLATQIKEEYKSFSKYETRYGFVQIKHMAPIHHTWITEGVIQKAFEAQKKRAKRQLHKNEKAPTTMALYMYKRSIKIDKIVAIKPPQGSEAYLTFTQTLQVLSHKERNTSLSFNNPTNFKFLVKWDLTEYRFATWQDEFVVRQLDKHGCLIQKYLHQFTRKDHLSKRYSFLTGEQKAALFDVDPMAYNFILKMAKFRWKYPIEVVMNDLKTKPFLPVCLYLNQIYILEQQRQTTLLLVPQKRLLAWEDALCKYCPFINWVSLRGSDKSIQIIKDIELQPYDGCLKFDVLLVSYQFHCQNIQFMVDSIKKTAMQLCVDLEDAQLLQKFNIYGLNYHLSKHLVYILNGNEKESLFENICGLFDTNIILKHNFSWTNIMVGPSKHFIETQGRQGLNLGQDCQEVRAFLKTETLPQIKRVLFLSYVLKHGFQVEKIDQIHEKMYQGCEEALVEPLTVNARHNFRLYVKSFFGILTHNGQVPLAQSIVDYYFFSFDPNGVIGRVLQLNRLRENIKQSLQSQSLGINGHGKASKEMHISDVYMGELILREGFGNWETIASDKLWRQYFESRNEPHIDQVAFVRQRAIQLLNRLPRPL